MTLRNHLYLVLAGSTFLYLALPFYASTLLIGGSVGLIPQLHPSTWLIVAAALVACATVGKRTNVESFYFWFYMAMMFFVVFATITTWWYSKSTGLKVVIDQIIGPILLFTLLRGEYRRVPQRIFAIRNALLAGVVLNIVVAYAVVTEAIQQPHRDLYKSIFGVFPAPDRGFGLTDQPLALAFVIMVALPLVLSLRSWPLRVIITFVMLAGVLLTQSRLGVVVAIVAVAYLIFQAETPIRRIGSVLVFFIILFYFYRSDLYDGVQRRFEYDSGSTLARSYGWEFALDNWQAFWWTGGGAGSVYRTVREAGANTSLESAFTIYGFDFGFVGTALFFGFLVAAVLRARHNSIRGARLAAALALVVVQTYSSISTQSAAGCVFWLAIALATCGTREVALQPTAPMPRSDLPAASVVNSTRRYA
ncbi:O-antigen ligase family protein [Rhodococcoides kroppenstedtii]|uniref:O-antigen ligase family protein n=1 Tax=Rhodococcoides kroppenstedtii TaxID=293050 RepID=UPI001BDED4CD|nr:O-antigen ligase family protein [Rhodococcus kroppenstedtii]MBT1191094.1 O-antigen ligase family protein [Rhodococcus kroppenstedtii]